MKKTLLLLVLLMSCAAVPSGRADLSLKEYSWTDKLGRGALNIISSPVEIARTISVTSKTKGNGYGWTVGLVEGIGKTIVRFGAGAVEVVTCPFEFPKENRAPLIEPEYPWQKWDAEYAASA